MKLILSWIGKTSEQYIKEGVLQYSKRIKRYTPFDIHEISNTKYNKNMPPESHREHDFRSISRFIKPDDMLIILDEKGNTYNSMEFSEYLNVKTNSNKKRLIFLIGGPFGFAPEIYKMAHDKISLSNLTFSHQLSRLIFMEQIYRAYTILKGHPYHNE